MIPEELLESRLKAAKEEKERQERNLNRIRSHYAWCYHCFDTFNWKKEHSIKIIHPRWNMESGMFPYCEECHRVISNERKKELVTQLVNLWISEVPEDIEEHLEVERLTFLAIDEGR